MQTIRALSELRSAVSHLRTSQNQVALVPTMGALHQGHLTLVRAARAHAEHVIVSIFVNPMQFGPTEDLNAYPRREEQDAAMLVSEGVDILWAPAVPTMYPAGHAAKVSVAGLDRVLCGAARPGHFDGVGTVVAKLFNQVQPDIALFGEKDWQQLAIIRRMAADLNFRLTIVGVPTVREDDGLAMSSRNAYLSRAERNVAAALPRALAQAARAIAGGTNVADALTHARTDILSAGFATIDYLEFRDGESLALVDRDQPGARLFVAARIGSTRLIDNGSIVGLLTIC